MPHRTRIVIGVCIGLSAALLATTPSSAWWPKESATPHTQTARTFVPEHPERQYAFRFTGLPVGSGHWQDVTGTPPPDGQIGRLEGMNYAQAILFANALSRARGLDACYDIGECSGEPSSDAFSCTGISARPLSCAGFRLPVDSEIRIVELVVRESRIAQWTHDGELEDARGVIAAYEDAREVAGFQLVRTVEYEPESSDD